MIGGIKTWSRCNLWDGKKCVILSTSEHKKYFLKAFYEIKSQGGFSSKLRTGT